MLNNENVMEKVKATSCPGSFGRQLRVVVFGEDGLTDTMIGSQNLPNPTETPEMISSVNIGTNFLSIN